MAVTPPDLITMGEAMVGLVPPDGDTFRRSTTLRRFTVGAEANVAVGVSRLGLQAQFVGLVGDDLAGEAVRDDLAAEGVDTTHLHTHPTAHTGLLVRELPPLGQPRVGYARRHSAGSHLDPSHLEALELEQARMCHVSGITPALGSGPARAALDGLRRVREGGGQASCDLNYRARLWSPGEAAPVLAELAEHADIVFGGADEWEMVAGTSALADHPLAANRVLVVTGGSGDIRVFVDGEQIIRPSIPTTAVDVVGAGDAFVAGVLAARLAGSPWPDAIDQGAYCGARVVSALGDWTNLPFGQGGLTTIPHQSQEVVR